MKTTLRIISFLLLATTLAFAQRFQARFVTSAYAWERYDAVKSSTQHLFGYQTVQLSLNAKDLYVGTYLQGFNDFAGPLKNDPLLRMYNLYAKYSNIGGLADVSVGRQAVFAGVGNGTIDGGLASLRLLNNQLQLTGYYGALPPPRQKIGLVDDAANNMMYGARLLIAPMEFAQASVSYMKRSIAAESYRAIRRDSLFNPITIDIKPSAGIEELLGGDLNLEFEKLFSGYLRYDYDLMVEKMARMQFFTRLSPFGSSGIKALAPLSLTGEYIQREPRLSYNSIFSMFAFNTLKEFEVGGEYALNPTWQLFAKFGTVDYGDNEDDQRVTLGMSTSHFSMSFSQSVGYSGELSAASINGGYPLLDNMITPTAFVHYAKYKLSEESSKLDEALSVGLGIVVRPMTALSIETQGQWIENKIYSGDIRLFVRISYYLSHQFAN